MDSHAMKRIALYSLEAANCHCLTYMSVTVINDEGDPYVKVRAIDQNGTIETYEQAKVEGENG